MSTDTLERETNASTVMFSSGDITRDHSVKFFEKAGKDGGTVLVVEDVPVFRTGSFEDSMGRRNTWEQFHIDDMVRNFGALRDSFIFEDVPVRDGHPGFFLSGAAGNGKVVGYHTDLRGEFRTSKHDGQEYYYLIANLEIIDPEAQQAIKSGLWRNRSAEIGYFITNDQAEYFPVYKGVAYVDIPAVEGIKEFSKHENVRVIKEESMTDGQHSAPVVPPQVPTAPVVPAVPAVPAAPDAAHAAPAQPADATHAAPAAAEFAFTINGQPVMDFAAVQNHITALETFRTETIEAGRVEFVNSLVKDNKIPATQLDTTVEFAKNLSDEQFESWKAIQSTAPALPLFAPVAAGGQFTQPQVDTAQAEVDTLKGVVQQHARAGMKKESIVATSSYQRLKQLDPAFEI